MTDAGPTDLPIGEEPGIARAGAAAAARRRELNISQRQLAADKIINASALIAFEKGRSWPRERTRSKLEEVLRWAPGTIARLRQGGAVAAAADPVPASEGHETPLIVQAVTTAVHTLRSAVETLPNPDDDDFTPRVTALLSDLRQLESVATRAAHIGKVSPALVKALGAVRRQIDELTALAAGAPRATLGQRLSAARRRSNLTVGETAMAAGVGEDVVLGLEAEMPVAPTDVQAIENLLAQLS